MKSQALLIALSAPMAAAFAPPRTSFRAASKLSAVDPSHLNDLPQHVDSLHHFFSSLTLADLDVDAVSTAAAAPVVPMDAAPGVDVAAAAATTDQGNGWFGFLTLPIEALLKAIHVGLTSVGMSADAWGVSIIAMTVVIKALTFPLTKSQLESTNKMQVRFWRGADLVV